jgi:hypothetical protein
VTHKRKNIKHKRLGVSLKKKLERKVKHGHYTRSTDSLLIKDAFLWLPSGDLKAETGSEITAAQAQTLQIKYAMIIIIIIIVNTENSNYFNNMTRQQTTYQRT